MVRILSISYLSLHFGSGREDFTLLERGSVREGVFLGECADLIADLGELCLVLVVLDALVDPVGDVEHLAFFHTTCGDGGAAEADTTGFEGGLFIKGNGVFVDGNACFVECFLGVFTGDVVGLKVDEHEVVVSGARDNAVAVFLHALTESFGIPDDLSLVGFECGLEGFVEANGLSGDDVHKRTSLAAREDLRVNGFGVFFGT